jgi:glutamate racemase
MIGIFDSGLGGLTILRALHRRFPDTAFIYFGDHANVPYGDKSSEEVVALTQTAVERLYALGCGLVLLGCNTATAVAARTLQRDWLPTSHWRRQGHNLLGIVAPTVEAATQTPWAVTEPQYPQKNRTDRLAVFGTTRTIQSGVYTEEIRKRCPRMRVTEQICAGLAGAIEHGTAESELDKMIGKAVQDLMAKTDGEAPDSAILGCTHFPLVEHLFRQHLPNQTRLLSQPDIVADSLEDYLQRHPHFTNSAAGSTEQPHLQLYTSGNAANISQRAQVFWPEAPAFSVLPETAEQLPASD